MLCIIPLESSAGVGIFSIRKSLFINDAQESAEWFLKATGMRLCVRDLPRVQDEFGVRVPERLHERYQPFVQCKKRLFKLAWISDHERYKWAAPEEAVPVMIWRLGEDDPAASQIKIFKPEKSVLQKIDAYVRPVNRLLRTHAIMLGLDGVRCWSSRRWTVSDLVARNFRRGKSPQDTAMDLLEALGKDPVQNIELVNTLAVAEALQAVPVRYVPWLEVID